MIVLPLYAILLFKIKYIKVEAIEKWKDINWEIMKYKIILAHMECFLVYLWFRVSPFSLFTIYKFYTGCPKRKFRFDRHIYRPAM